MKTPATTPKGPIFPPLFQITSRSENDVFETAHMFDQSNSSHLQPELKTIEFHLQAPFAKSVKLAADFTDWGIFPLDMIKSDNGVWFINVPLPLGHYSYRFIVDGHWCGDLFGVAHVGLDIT